MRRPNTFQHPPLDRMVAVGAIGPRSARLWVRCATPGPWRVRCWPEGSDAVLEGLVWPPEGGEVRDHTTSFEVPGDLEGSEALAPGRRYRYAIDDARGERIGSGRFVTAPASPARAPERLTFGLFSCHQPYGKRGVHDLDSEAMLRAAHRCLDENDARLVLTVGDQMYSDAPRGLSLFDSAHFRHVAPPGRETLQDCSVEEVRRLYQARYRQFWASPAWQAIHADFPCYPILDDHDLVDNWGSDPAHHQEEGWQRIGAGGRLAYQDYQHTRLVAPSAGLAGDFHYVIDHGDVALFVLDLRSQRRAGEDGRLYGPDQAAALERFLAERRDRSALFVVCSVPPVHLPRAVARVAAALSPDGEDFSDRWTSGAHLEDRDKFFELLHAHQQRVPGQRLVILGGDIHMGCAHEIEWHNATRLHQFVSSAITNHSGWLVQTAAKLSIAFTSGLRAKDGALKADVRALEGTGRGRGHNPTATLNLGLVEVEGSPGAQRRVRFRLFGHRGDQPVQRYCSPWLASHVPSAGVRDGLRVSA